jgi:DNA polymerase III alpha subunit (gram-positive type)
MLFAVFDTETTGLPYHELAPLDMQPRVIEFGGIITDGKEIIDEIEFICNPGIQIEPKITEITGLTNADLNLKGPFSDHVEELQEYFMQADAYIAHNASFDRHMLQFDLKRIKKTLETIRFPLIPICTVEQTYHAFGRRMKLTELYNMFCGVYVQKHRALDDVRLLHELCQKLGVYEAYNSMETA